MDKGDPSLNALLALRKQSLEAFDKRRSYEWKISLALWSGIGLMTGFLYPNRESLAATTPQWLITVIFATVVLVYGFVWAPEVARRQRDDLAQAEAYRRAAETLLTGKPIDQFGVLPASYWKGFVDFASWTKSVITACFFLLALLIVFL
jgi:hypothetical protein